MAFSPRLSSKDAIIAAGFDLLSRDSGASLGDIASHAGVGRATLHRHFASRGDLIKTMAMIAIEEMDEAAEAACEKASSYADALRRMLDALIPLGDRHGFLAREPLEDDPDITKAFERQLGETREMVEAAKKEGAFDYAAPTAWITQAYDHLLYAAWESVKAGEATHAQAADLAWRTLTNGLGDKAK
ncbi:MAG: helix-turn-helix domain-containing protein [Pseudomonadota bacterium]